MSEEIDTALMIMTGDVKTARALSIASAYLYRAGKPFLADDMRSAADDRRGMANGQRMRILASIVKSADDVGKVDPSLLIAILQRSPEQITTRLACAGLIEAPEQGE